MSKVVFYPLVISWAVAVVACIAAVEHYAGTEGAGVPAHSDLPRDTALQLAADRPTALIFAHPKCPCTQAAIQEFQRIEARHPDAFQTLVLFGVPESASPDWTDTRLVAQAAHLESAKIIFDERGREAKRFQATVSGQVLLYAPEGRLLYAGGVTGARGHEGANGGQEAFEYMVRHTDEPSMTFPVFGCALITGSELATLAEAGSENG